MPRSIHNARPCSCCHRLRPIKTKAKAQFCCIRCANAATDAKREAKKERIATVVLNFQTRPVRSLSK